MSRRYSLYLGLLLLFAGLAAPAFGQDQPAPAAPAGPPAPAAKPAPKSEPAKHPPAKPAAAAPTTDAQIENVVFGAWALRCRKPPGKKETEKEAPQKGRACEISETLEAQDHSGPIAKLSVGRPGGKGELHAIVIVPNNVGFPSSVHIRSDDKDIWGVRLDWVRCIPGGCFADALLADATLNYWHGLDTVGEIVFIDSTGDQISLPMSFHGFGQALDALNKAS
jgi:invasion protein IalB